MDRHLGTDSYTLFRGLPHVTADAIEEGFEPAAKWDKPTCGVAFPTADLTGTRMGIASRDTAAGPLCLSALNQGGVRADQDLPAVYEGTFQDVMVKQRSPGGLDAFAPAPVHGES